MIHSGEGDQLSLALFGEVDPARAAPWLGRSPRSLTASYKRFILKPRAQKSVSDFVTDENQYDLWLTVKRAPVIYTGAPCLYGLSRSEEL